MTDTNRIYFSSTIIKNLISTCQYCSQRPTYILKYSLINCYMYRHHSSRWLNMCCITEINHAYSPIRVLEALSLGVKQPGCEADHSPPSSAEVKERIELPLHSPNTPSWHGAQLKEALGLYSPIRPPNLS
jgi:hypothetical protein